MGYYCNNIDDHIECCGCLLLDTVLSDFMQKRAEVRCHANVCKAITTIPNYTNSKIKNTHQGGGVHNKS